MKKRQPIVPPPEIAPPLREPETPKPYDPEEPLIPEEDPDVIPEEDPFETPPYEVPSPGERP